MKTTTRPEWSNETWAAAVELARSTRKPAAAGQSTDFTAEAFRSALRAIRLTMGDFCAVTRVNLTTASYWGRERPGAGFQEFPAWVPLLIGAWRRYPELLAKEGP